MTFARCQHENPDDARFCRVCGSPLGHVCPSCGRVSAPDSCFCTMCGHALAPVPARSELQRGAPQAYTPPHLAEKILTSRSALQGERKHVTVLFCDIANSTALAERRGAETMHTILDQFFELALGEVHRYEGTINQFLGDGFMALFGAPVAHEDHARRAVLAALGIQRVIREQPVAGGNPENRLTVRMGLNTGPVVVGKIGDNLRMDYTAVGDTTNLAARLQQVAEPGTILMSEATNRLVRGYVRVEALAPFAVKGKTEPVMAHRAVGLGTRRSQLEAQDDRTLSPFAGREKDLAVLQDAMAQAEAGHGQVVGIVGDAGVGKSRLLYEFHRHLDDRHAMYLEGRCLSYGSAMPFLPVQDIVRATCGITDTDTPQEIGKRVRIALEQVGMSPDDGAPYLLQLLGVTEGTEGLAAIGPEAIKARIFSTLVQMSVAGSRQRPIVFAVEDLQWIDKTSEEYFTTAVEAVAGAPILLVTTYRPGYRPPWIDKSYATQMAVRPLAAGDSRSVVEAVMQRAEATDALVQAIVGKAEGNPFFLEELTRVLLEQHSGTVTAVPETIQGVLLARIDRLPEGQKRVLQTAAVLGREFSGRLLRAVWDGAEDLEPELGALTRQELLYARGGAEDTSYVFKHALTQDVAYESLLTGRRHALHEAAGRALEAIHPEGLEQYCELLAHHYSHSANAEKALDYLELANQKAARANAMEEARAYFDEAMKLLDTMAETEANQRRRVALLVNQVLVMLLTAKFSVYYELLTHHEPIAVRLGDPGLLGAFYARLGYCEWVFGHLDKAIQTFAKAVDLCETSGRAEDAGQAYSQWQWTHVFRGDYDQVLALKERAVRVLERHFNLRWYAWALAAASWAYAFLGRWEHAVEEGQKGLRMAEECSDNSAISFAAWNTSMAYAYKGDLAEALVYAELAVEKAPTPADKAWAQSFRGWVWCRAGEPHKGVEILGALVPMYRAAGFVPGEIFALFLGEGYWLAGEYENATQTLEEVLKMAQRYGLKFHFGCAHRILGEIALKTNPAQVEAPLAAPHFAESIAMLRAIKAENELALAYAGYGRLHKQQGSVGQARNYLTRALEVFERLGTLIEPDKVRQELAELPSAHTSSRWERRPVTAGSDRKRPSTPGNP